MKRKQFGFTIVELLVVIVVVGILAGLSTMAYNSVIENAQKKQRETDMEQLVKAIIIARKNTGKSLGELTGQHYSLNYCLSSPTEPRTRPKTDQCWHRYYENLRIISEASGVDLTPLKKGDPRGNPYMWDEEECASSSTWMNQDKPIGYFTGKGKDYVESDIEIPKLGKKCRPWDTSS